MPSQNPVAQSAHEIPGTNAYLPKYLHRRGTTYYFKRRIPADVAHGYPQFHGQIWKSLDTDLLSRAKVFLAVEISEFELTVAALRRKRAVENAAGHLGIKRSAHFPDEISGGDDAVAQLSQIPLAAQTELRYVPPFGDAPTSTSQRKMLIAGPSPNMKPSRLPGKPATSPPLVQPDARKSVVSSNTPHANPNHGLISPTVLHLFEDWKRGQSRPRTVNAVHTAVMEFRTLHGPLAVEVLTKQHARAYRDYLIERKLSKGTVENRLGFLSTLVRYGMREIVEHLTLNPFEHIEVTGAQGLRRKKDRRAYDVSELNTIFSSELYTADYRPNGQVFDAAYWLPILGPFLGARIEEACQLRVEDVQRINGVWCVRICDLGEDQKVKTDSSFRRVPLHEVVIQSGFLAYVAKMAQAGHALVFPTLTNENANGIYSNAAGKWYGRFLETIGLTDHRLDYHSFRYTFRQQCSLCGVENEVRDALTGHWVSNNDSGRAYMKAENRQYPFPKLTSAMQQLRYDELRIRHIFVDDPMAGVEAALLK